MSLLRTAAVVSLAPALLLAACGDDTATVLDLTVIHQVPFIEFGAMEGDVPEQSAPGEMVNDLRSVADYVRLEPHLLCAALDPRDSFVDVRTVLAPGLETPLTFQVDIAPASGTSWRPLFDLNGIVADGESMSLNDPRLLLYQEGLDLLSALALADPPVYELRVTGTVPQDIDDLTLGLDLAIDFSNHPRGCPF
ncbi:MAG: hypothetical protein ACQEXJ_00760 [Myxococcota bacterium]